MKKNSRASDTITTLDYLFCSLKKSYNFSASESPWGIPYGSYTSYSLKHKLISSPQTLANIYKYTLQLFFIKSVQAEPIFMS